jgi:hypothetical protein
LVAVLLGAGLGVSDGCAVAVEVDVAGCVGVPVGAPGAVDDAAFEGWRFALGRLSALVIPGPEDEMEMARPFAQGEPPCYHSLVMVLRTLWPPP